MVRQMEAEKQIVEASSGKIITVQAVDLSGVFERMEVLERKLDFIAEELAETQALIRKQIYQSSKDYNEFKTWVEERIRGQYDYITSNDIVAEFRVSKPTALAWMERVAREDPRYVLHKPDGRKPYRLALNLQYVKGM